MRERHLLVGERHLLGESTRALLGRETLVEGEGEGKGEGDGDTCWAGERYRLVPAGLRPPCLQDD